jgi:uncharacterized protein
MITAKNPPALSPGALRNHVVEYLETHHTMTIASSRDNIPWASAVFYASDGLDLYFFSKPGSRHGVNMAANDRVGVAIHEDYRHWKAVRGIQMEGRAELLRSPKLKALFWSIYRRKFPFVDEFFKPGALLASVRQKVAGIRLYRIVPETVWYLDAGCGFGHRAQLDLNPPSPD